MTAFEARPVPSPAFDKVARFTRGLKHDEIPGAVRDFGRLLMLDLVGVAIAGTRVDAGRIARDFAVEHWAAGPAGPSARLIFDGRRASLPGAAYALATQLDNLDAHDGWQPSKGHAGAALMPALVAFAEAVSRLSGPDALTALIIGYEIACRSAWALHATTADYHTSGAWNALGCTAVGARLLGLGGGAYRHALGIAEFHAPRSQMLREIANPTMLHDGTGWGAPAGVSAVLLAAKGFTGAPAATIEFDDARFAWEDLGTRWITTEQYVKPYPVCRWAHAPIDCALNLCTAHRLTSDDVAGIEIRTFLYSTQLWNDLPGSSPVAQYALAWPVAAAVTRGKVTVDEILPESFADPAIRRLVSATRVFVDDECEAAYPARRMASVTLLGRDGRRYESGVREASGGPVPPPAESDVIAKFRAFSTPVIGADRTAAIESAVLSMNTSRGDFKRLIDLCAPPP